VFVRVLFLAGVSLFVVALGLIGVTMLTVPDPSQPAREPIAEATDPAAGSEASVEATQDEAAQQVAEAPDSPQTQPEPESGSPVTDLRSEMARILDVIETGQITDLQPDVTPDVADKSARFADFLRRRTGDVPDADSFTADGLIVQHTENDRWRKATPAYYEVWDDLLRRCWTSVIARTPFDETGLTPKGEKRLNYAADSKQVWHSQNKAFKVTYSVREARSAPEGTARSCRLETNRFVRVAREDVTPLKARYDRWWAEERLEATTEYIPNPYKTREQDTYHGAITHFGSSQGCRLHILYRDMNVASETDAYFYVWETERGRCKRPAVGKGKVRVNRLPQIAD